MELNRLDLNLLQLMVQIHDTGSVSVAGKRMGLSQPAASNALGRLRQALGDTLFVRGREGMVPTTFADRVVPEVRRHLAGIDAALSAAAGFDPKTSRRTFRLSLSGLGEQTFLPPLAARVLAEAPGVRLDSVTAPLGDLARALSVHQADVAVGLLDIRDRNLREIHLFDEVYRAIASPGLSPEEAAALDLATARIILVAPSATYAEDIEAVIDRRGLSGNIVLRMGHFGALSEMLRALNAVAVVPGEFAERLAAAGAATLLPGAMARSQPGVKLVWHSKTTEDGGCAWLRAMICDLFRQV